MKYYKYSFIIYYTQIHSYCLYFIMSHLFNVVLELHSYLYYNELKN